MCFCVFVCQVIFPSPPHGHGGPQGHENFSTVKCFKLFELPRRIRTSIKQKTLRKEIMCTRNHISLYIIVFFFFFTIEVIKYCRWTKRHPSGWIASATKYIIYLWFWPKIEVLNSNCQRNKIFAVSKTIFTFYFVF